ncbi:hypothetical protein GTO89_08115 [Heliobacterium gestii]|uniref:DUF5610 domain-containing protein n=1 Tax=Heliomicrobium gestii TaxID=2699 RepID=A0A845L9V4_HELGE|nr:hypothetical protein [Heliomicrobium gestii]MBM7866722.1 hypothetical protein [Heliomicrobium gestii]MZP42998.1 hypothetical protein [Heliomicrobium gestii]
MTGIDAYRASTAYRSTTTTYRGKQEVSRQGAKEEGKAPSTAPDAATKPSKEGDVGAIVELGQSEPKGTYQVSWEEINRLKQQAEQQYNRLIETVRHLIVQQGKSGKDGEDSDGEIDDQDESVIDSPELKAAREQAARDIEDGGEFGADKVSERILKFAVALSGGDPSRLDVLRKGFEDGYKKAAEAFGGDLPAVCQDTYQKVIDGFDKWEETGKAPEFSDPDA